MLKYAEFQVTFSEVPDEICLSISLSCCPIHCENCHSKYLWNDIGQRLTPLKLKSIMDNNNGVSCLVLLGGDSDPKEVSNLFSYVRILYPNIKTCWYSGQVKEKAIEHIDLNNFDYIKVGPYIKQYGGLDSPKTNQALLKVIKDNNKFTFEDITYKFKKDYV